MNLNPLGSQFFRYRKRKQISVDGRTPGLEYPTRHHESTPPPSTGHAAQHSSGHDYLGAHDRAEYHPGHAFYSSSSPNYHPSQSWHNMHFLPTPELRTPPGTTFPAIPPESPVPDIQVHFDPNRQSELDIADIWRRVLAQVAYQNSVDQGNLIKSVAEQLGVPAPTQSLIEQFMENSGSTDDGGCFISDEGGLLTEPIFPEFADVFGVQDGDGGSGLDEVQTVTEQLTLEDIVEQEWEQLNSFSMQDPMIDPFDQFPPGMHMDPFGPMGFGM